VMVFPSAGTWSVTVSVSGPAGEDSRRVAVNVSCAGDGAVGERCCDASQCNNGLTCVFGACADTPGILGDKCYAGSECETDECGKDNTCQPESTCTDEIANGDETDVDCGGGECSPCAAGEQCATNADCAMEWCQSGVCTDPPGKLLGKGDSVSGSATVTVVQHKQNLSGPADLEFNPANPNELWVANQNNDSIAIIHNPGKPDQSSVRYIDGGHHFLEEVVSLSFGDQGTMGTCGATQNTYNDFAPPNNYMGPALWPGSYSEFEKHKCNAMFTPRCPDAANVHLDMLHNSPLCMGIAAAGGNTFYVFSGFVGEIDFYDFGEPHVSGGTYHGDGKKKRFAGIGVKRVGKVPGHLYYDWDTGWLYIADTGNSRIIRMDTNTGSKSGMFPTYPDEVWMDTIVGATVEEIVPKSAQLVFEPSGILIHEGYIYVSDNANGLVNAFDMNGARVKVLDTGLGANAVSGMDVGPDGKLYMVDRKGDGILRVDP
jgi:hypothetical protein